jgi:hypothetical protein
MLEKVVAIDKIEILEDGQIQIRKATKILEDGVEIGKSYHRHVLAPEDDLKDQHPRVVVVANLIWTPEIVMAWNKRKSEGV